jgi:ubiquinone/menaquinone biosynthesis C-methylase UbiE
MISKKYKRLLKRNSDLQGNLVTKYFSDAKSYKNLYSDQSATGHFFSIRVKRIFELLDGHKGGRILDIGCGPGMMIPGLIKRNYKYYGVDISQAMIFDCKREFADTNRVDLLVGRIESLPFPESSFDIVLCMGIMEYIVNVKQAFEEISRVIKRDGILIASMLNKESPYRIWDYKIIPKMTHMIRKASSSSQKLPEPALRLYSEDDFKGFFEYSLFEVTEVVYYDFNVFLSPLDRYFAKLEVLLAERLEPLSKSIFRKLGTGFIVKGKRL